MEYKGILVALLLCTLATCNGCNCGWTQKGKKDDRNTYGVMKAEVNRYPFMATVARTYSNISPYDKVWCASTIISNRYAVSAAHCLPQLSELRYYGLLVGEHNLSTKTGAGKTYTIEYCRKHENYKAATFQNDIALIKTQLVIKFSSSVGPVCLPYYYTGFMSFEGKKVKILGWGTYGLTGRKSDVLKETDVTVVTNNFCAAKLPRDIITNDMICVQAYRQGACQYDSGSPLLWYNQNNDRHILIGILSFGDGCGSNKPGVYTKITSYIDWIHSKIQDSTYCTKN